MLYLFNSIYPYYVTLYVVFESPLSKTSIFRMHWFEFGNYLGILAFGQFILCENPSPPFRWLSQKKWRLLLTVRFLFFPAFCGHPWCASAGQCAQLSPCPHCCCLRCPCERQVQRTRSRFKRRIREAQKFQEAKKPSIAKLCAKL